MNSSNEDKCQALIAPFQALNGNALQRRALNALVKALTHQQIRELRFSLEEIVLDLYCDIVAELPLEISQIILRYLPLSQLFQARRVSSKWNWILSSPQSVEPLLQHWFSTPAADTALQIPTGLSANSILSLTAEHIEAYRTGHPFSYARHKWSCLQTPKDPDLVAYADGIMAWVDKSDSHFIRLLDLRTGQEWSFLPEARTSVDAIAVSSSMIAALGSGRCHIWTLQNGDHYYIRLPSARPADIAVSGETLAISLPSWYEASPRVEVVTWTLKDQGTVSFFVALSLNIQRFSQFSIILDNEGGSLLLYEQADDPSRGFRPAHTHYFRTSLNGHILAQGSIRLPEFSDSYQWSTDTVPKEVNGRAVIWSYIRPEGGESEPSELILICYNFRENQLEVCTQAITGLRRSWFGLSNLFSWKDAAYFLDYRDQHYDLRVIDLHELTCSEAKMDISIYAQEFDRKSRQRVETQKLLFGDETFLILNSGRGFCVWCFDKNVQLSNEDMAYKEQRRNNIERQILSKPNRDDPISDNSLTHKLDETSFASHKMLTGED